MKSKSGCQFFVGRKKYIFLIVFIVDQTHQLNQFKDLFKQIDINNIINLFVLLNLGCNILILFQVK